MLPQTHIIADSFSKHGRLGALGSSWGPTHGKAIGKELRWITVDDASKDSGAALQLRLSALGPLPSGNLQATCTDPRDRLQVPSLCSGVVGVPNIRRHHAMRRDMV